MTTIYNLPVGAHSVSARGREFIGDERGQIDLKDVDTGTILDLVTHAGVTPEKAEEEKRNDTEVLRQRAEFLEAARKAGEDARSQDDALIRDAQAKHEAGIKNEQERLERESLALAHQDALKNATPFEQVTPAEGPDPHNTPGSDNETPEEVADPDSRSVVPPRRKRPSPTDPAPTR